MRQTAFSQGNGEDRAGDDYYSITGTHDDKELVDGMDAVDRILTGLSRVDRMMARLYWIEKLTMSEIGRAIGISESAVSQRLASATGVVRSRFEGG